MQQNEFKDSRLKYIELPRQFSGRANDVNLTAKQHLRICQQLAVRLSKDRPKTSQEFEKNEYLKDFVIKSAQLNEKIIDLLDYVQSVLNAIAADSECVAEALTKDTLRLQSETIEILMQSRNDLVKDLYEDRKRQLNSGRTSSAA